jgi:hypothetical protein
MKAQQNFTKNLYGLVESILYRGHRFAVVESISHCRECVEVEPHSGKHCASKTEENVTEVRAFLRSDRQFTVRMFGSELILNHKTVHDILTEELISRHFDAASRLRFLSHCHHRNDLTKKGIPLVLKPP